jgi:hypothetical protein
MYTHSNTKTKDCYVITVYEYTQGTTLRRKRTQGFRVRTSNWKHTEEGGQ